MIASKSHRCRRAVHRSARLRWKIALDPSSARSASLDSISVQLQLHLPHNNSENMYENVAFAGLQWTRNLNLSYEFISLQVDSNSIGTFVL